MNYRIARVAATLILGCAVSVVVGAPTPAPATRPTVAGAKAPVLSRAETQFFESKVRPILAANCYQCHSAEAGKAKGGLLLDTRDGWVKGGEHGAAIVPGDVGKSRLILAVSYK